MKNKSQKFAELLFQTVTPHRNQADPATIYAGDLHQPWKSAYGFPLTAARLAAHQPLLLHCREDEVFELLARLNDLTTCPQAMAGAYEMLHKLAGCTCERLLCRLQQEEIRKGDEENRTLGETSEQKGAERLQQLLTPDHPSQEIAGLSRQLARLLALRRELGLVKGQGFRVVVFERRRQPARPALAARRDELILLEGPPSAFPAGFLLPPATHQTLWSYNLRRSGGDRSAVWN